MTDKIPIILSGRALILNQKDELLLVTHQGENFWYSPGGRSEERESLLSCAKREVYEETGLKVDLEKLVFVEEYLSDHREEIRQHIAFFFFGRVDQDLPKQWEDVGGSAPIIAKFLSEEEIKNLEQVYPKYLKSDFWQEFKNGFKDHNPYKSSL